MSGDISFLEIFPGCEPLKEYCGGLEAAKVSSVIISEQEMTMTVSASFSDVPAPSELESIEQKLSDMYGLVSVVILADYPWPENEEPANVGTNGKQLLGKESKAKPVPMSDINIDSGTITVQGTVFEVNNREIQRRGAKLLSFSMTDNTGSVRVTHFYDRQEDSSICDKIHEGQFLTVRGKIVYSKFDDDLVLDPTSIRLGTAPVRMDNSEKKRVELHLHTRYSALDAITDPEKLIERAALWGHKAVAVTDHGVAQAFPELDKYGKKSDIKVIYGLEAYYVNDVDSKIAIRGQSELPLDTEYVAFDLETTGLYASSDRIIEIGAVVFKSGEIKERFNSFVNPGMLLPSKITELTGITNKDLYDAPEEKTAVEAFLKFSAGRPLVAHNADFDIGFIACACERNEIEFEPVSVDTLALAQRLLPQLRRHRLDVVAKHLGLPEFSHHRASDDAAAAAGILGKLLEILKEMGIERLSEIDGQLQKLSGKEHARSRHITILARNRAGLKNLYKLISASYLKNYARQPIVLRSMLESHREGLLIGSACSDGEVFSAVLRGEPGAELRRIASFYDYIEIMPAANNRYLFEGGSINDDDGLRDLNMRIARLAAEVEKPLVATGDVHFLDPEDEIYRKILLASKNFSDADEDRPFYFLTTDEMLEEFAYLGKRTCYDAVIGNPNKIADMCEKIELLPKGLFPPKIENSANELKKLVADKLLELYGDNPHEIIRKRVDTELGDILSRKYDVIYMSAQRLVAESNANGYLVGSRGSVGSSIVAYLSGITEVNSLPAHYLCPQCKYTDFESGREFGCGVDMPDMSCPNCGASMNKEGFDIPFETFLGFGGDKVPDIDLNFSGEYQARAHKHTEEMFGAEHVFRAGTIGTIAKKTAYGYVMKYLEERGLEKSKAEEDRLANGLVGVKRTTGQHPGGLVIVPQNMEMEDFCPVQHPADDPGSGVITTHFDYHCMEDNLLKLDELGHDDPTMLKMLADLTGVDVVSIPLDDPETRLIFKSPSPLGIDEDDPIILKTGSIGIPEFGTPFTRQMLMDIKPEDFDTLVRISGFSHGTDVWLGNARDLVMSGEASVKETIGCRDDIMLYLISKGVPERQSFSIMESVRKGRGLQGVAEREMQSVGVPDWYIESCKKIKYLFPKAHAVAYVIMAFRIAWFKVHYPLEFYSAYFYRRSQKDAFDAEMMTRGIESVRRKIKELHNEKKLTKKDEELLTTMESVYEFYLRGFEFAPIDLYESDAMKFLVVGNHALRPPFVAISGLGATAAADLAQCKEMGQEFISIEELCAVCSKVSSTHIEQLRALGALGEMPEQNQMTLF